MPTYKLTNTVDYLVNFTPTNSQCAASLQVARTLSEIIPLDKIEFKQTANPLVWNLLVRTNPPFAKTWDQNIDFTNMLNPTMYHLAFDPFPHDQCDLITELRSHLVKLKESSTITSWKVVWN